MDKILEKWDEILQTVKTEHDVSDISFDTWIKPLEVFGVEGNTLYILVPSEQMTLSYISKKYYLPLKVAIAEIIGTEYEIQFILPEQTRNIRPSNNKGKKTHPRPNPSTQTSFQPDGDAVSPGSTEIVSPWRYFSVRSSSAFKFM